MFQATKSLFGSQMGLNRIGALVVPGGIMPSPASLVTDFDDMLGDVITDQYGVNKGSDGATVNFAALASSVNGELRGTMGAGAGATMAANGLQLHKFLQWKANAGNLFFEARVKLSAITAVALFIGWTDQIAALEMPIESAGSVDTLTSNATDAVGFMFDTRQSTDNWWAVGVANDVDATHQNLGVAPVADTYERFGISINSSGAASFYRNGRKIGASVMTGALTPTVALTPVIAGYAPAAAARDVTVDYLLLGATRV